MAAAVLQRPSLPPALPDTEDPLTLQSVKSFGAQVKRLTAALKDPLNAVPDTLWRPVLQESGRPSAAACHFQAGQALAPDERPIFVPGSLLSGLFADCRRSLALPLVSLNISGMKVQQDALTCLRRGLLMRGANSRLVNLRLAACSLPANTFALLGPADGLKAKLQRLDVSGNPGLAYQGAPFHLCAFLHDCVQLRLLCVQHTGLTHEDLEYLCCQLQQHAGTWGRLQVLSLGPPTQQQEQAASQDGAWSNAAFAQLCSAAARLPSLAVLEVWGLSIPQQETLSERVSAAPGSPRLQDGLGQRSREQDAAAAEGCRLALPNRSIDDDVESWPDQHVIPPEPVDDGQGLRQSSSGTMQDHWPGLGAPELGDEIPLPGHHGEAAGHQQQGDHRPLQGSGARVWSERPGSSSHPRARSATGGPGYAPRLPAAPPSRARASTWEQAEPLGQGPVGPPPGIAASADHVGEQIGPRPHQAAHRRTASAAEGGAGQQKRCRRHAQPSRGHRGAGGQRINARPYAPGVEVGLHAEDRLRVPASQPRKQRPKACIPAPRQAPPQAEEDMMGMDQAHASQLDDGVIDLAAGPDADADADATPSDSDGSYSTESGKSDDAFVAPDDIDQSHLRRGQNESGSDQEEPDGEPPEPDEPSLADEVKDLESFAFDKRKDVHKPGGYFRPASEGGRRRKQVDAEQQEAMRRYTEQRAWARGARTGSEPRVGSARQDSPTSPAASPAARHQPRSAREYVDLAAAGAQSDRSSPSSPEPTGASARRKLSAKRTLESSAEEDDPSSGSPGQPASGQRRRIHKAAAMPAQITAIHANSMLRGRDSQVPRRQTSPIFEQPLDPMPSPQQQQQQQPEQAQQQEQSCQHRGLEQTASQPAPPQPLSREAKRLKPFDWDRRKDLHPPNEQALNTGPVACTKRTRRQVQRYCHDPPASAGLPKAASPGSAGPAAQDQPSGCGQPLGAPGAEDPASSSDNVPIQSLPRRRAAASLPLGKAAAAVESDPSSPAPSPMQTSSPDAPQGLAEPSDQASPHHWSPLASSGGCQQHSGRPSPHSQAAPDLPAAEMVPELQQTASSRPTTAPHLLPAAPHLQGSPSPLPEASASPPPDALQSPSQPAAPVLPAGWSPAAGHLSQPRSPAPAPAQPPGWLPAAADSSHAVLGPDPSPQRRSRMVAASAAHRPCSDALPSPIASPVQQAPRCSPADHADAADVPVDDVMPSMSAAASQQQGTAAGEGVAGAAGQPAAAQLAACQPTTDGILPTASAAPALQQGMTVSAQGAQPGGGVEGSAGAQAQDLGLTAGVPSGGLAVDGAASLPPGTLAPIQSPEQRDGHLPQNKADLVLDDLLVYDSEEE